MKITAFNPLIVSKNADELREVFEHFGFEQAHEKGGIEGKGGEVVSYDLKHPDGFRVNVASSGSVPQDIMSIRINVDNFDEAYDYLIERGFKNAQGDKVTDTGTSKATLMFAPSGFAINLVQHIKN